MIYRFPSIRSSICKHCPTKCNEFLSGSINYSDPLASCSIHVWNQIELDGVRVTTVSAPTFPNASTWKELHERGMTYFGQDDSEWLLKDFTRRIQGLGCACRQHWSEIIKTNPPRYNDYFAWTVEAHNTINQRLGKPIVTLEAAKGLWNHSQPPLTPSIIAKI